MTFGYTIPAFCQLEPFSCPDQLPPFFAGFLYQPLCLPSLFCHFVSIPRFLPRCLVCLWLLCSFSSLVSESVIVWSCLDLLPRRVRYTVTYWSIYSNVISKSASQYYFLCSRYIVQTYSVESAYQSRNNCSWNFHYINKNCKCLHCKFEAVVKLLWEMLFISEFCEITIK